MSDVDYSKPIETPFQNVHYVTFDANGVVTGSGQCPRVVYDELIAGGARMRRLDEAKWEEPVTDQGNLPLE